MSVAEPPALAFDDVSVVRGGRLIWSEGTFDVPSGGITAVIGSNGSGKTTLLQVVLGLVPVASGTVEVLGRPAGEATSAIGYVPQNYAAVPGDAIRALAQLVTFSAVGSASGAALTLQAESVRLFRRAAAGQLVLAAADYVPLSDQDAEAVRAIVVAALDSAISDAGDNGDDELYQALQALKAAAVADINARGAAVPELRIVSTPASLPSLVLAHRLYGDIGREAELVSRARPRHPAFMPTSFKALSE